MDAKLHNYITNSCALCIVTSGHIPEHSRGTLELTKKNLTNFLIKRYQYLRLNLSIHSTHKRKCLELFTRSTGTKKIANKNQRQKKQRKLGGQQDISYKKGGRDFGYNIAKLTQRSGI